MSSRDEEDRITKRYVESVDAQGATAQGGATATTNGCGRHLWTIPVNDLTEFRVRQYDDGFLVWFTGTGDGDVVMDRGGLRAMRSLIDMVDLVLGEEQR